MTWSLVASAVAVAVAGPQYWPIVIHLLCAFSRNILTKAKDIHLPNESSVYTVISKAAGGGREGVQLERMPVTMSGPLGCQTSVNVQRRPALPRRRHLMAFRHDCAAYGLWLMPVHRLLAYGFLASIALMTLELIMKCA